MLKKIEDTIYKIGEWICIAFMLLMVVIVVITVVGRYIFNSTPPWGNELAIACMIWFGLVSSALAERDKRHIRITVVDSWYPPIVTRILKVLIYFAKLAFSVIIMWNSLKLVKFNKNVYMTGAPISESVVSFAGFVMGALMVIFLLCHFKKEVLNK
ncbi:MAG: TRAP transporter small permease [Sphaerochaetaceae bacterium]|nr:TRAP transporter small permease [Sphaerochaetaceae bacterium]